MRNRSIKVHAACTLADVPSFIEDNYEAKVAQKRQQQQRQQRGRGPPPQMSEYWGRCFLVSILHAYSPFRLQIRGLVSTRQAISRLHSRRSRKQRQCGGQQQRPILQYHQDRNGLDILDSRRRGRRRSVLSKISCMSSLICQCLATSLMIPTIPPAGSSSKQLDRQKRLATTRSMTRS